MKIGSGIDIRVEDIAQKEEHMLRPIDEDHVKVIKKGLESNRRQAPAIIVQKVRNAFFVRAHNHTFLALRACLERDINCRIIEGTEEEIIAYCVREQANIKDWKPEEYANAYLRIKRELDKESEKPITIRELADYCKISRSRMGELIKGVKDERVINLIKGGASFDGARTTIKKVVRQSDKPKVEETKEELTKPDGHTLGDDSGPILDLTPGDDGEVEQPEISPEGEGISPSPTKPDGEPGKAGEDQSQPEETTSTSPPESSPSKNGWKKGWYCKDCGTFLEDGTKEIVFKRNNHTCKDITTLLRRYSFGMSNFVETKLLPGEKTSDFLIKESYGPHQLTDDRLKEALIHAREIKVKAPVVLKALENLERFNGRMVS